MLVHQFKSLLNGKTDIGMLTANRMHVSKKHHSAEAVAICMLLHQYALSATRCGRRFDSFSFFERVTQVVRVTAQLQVRILLQIWFCIVQW